MKTLDKILRQSRNLLAGAVLGAISILPHLGYSGQPEFKGLPITPQLSAYIDTNKVYSDVIPFENGYDPRDPNNPDYSPYFVDMSNSAPNNLTLPNKFDFIEDAVEQINLDEATNESNNKIPTIYIFGYAFPKSGARIEIANAKNLRVVGFGKKVVKDNYLKNQDLNADYGDNGLIALILYETRFMNCQNPELINLEYAPLTRAGIDFDNCTSATIRDSAFFGDILNGGITDVGIIFGGNTSGTLTLTNNLFNEIGRAQDNSVFGYTVVGSALSFENIHAGEASIKMRKNIFIGNAEAITIENLSDLDMGTNLNHGENYFIQNNNNGSYKIQFSNVTANANFIYSERDVDPRTVTLSPNEIINLGNSLTSTEASQTFNTDFFNSSSLQKGVISKTATETLSEEQIEPNLSSCEDPDNRFPCLTSEAQNWKGYE